MELSDDSLDDPEFLQALDNVEQSLAVGTQAPSPHHVDHAAASSVPLAQTGVRSSSTSNGHIIPSQHEDRKPAKPSFGGAARPPPHLPSGHRLPPPDPELAKKLSRTGNSPARTTQPHLSTANSDASTSAVTAETLELREKLRQMQSSLESKDGEVSNLRRNIKKEQDDREKARCVWLAEKESMENSLRESAKSHTLELERLQTEYAFKRQELETSVRRGSKATPTSLKNRRLTSGPSGSSPIRGAPSVRKPMSIKHPTASQAARDFKSFHNSFDEGTSSRKALKGNTPEKSPRNDMNPSSPAPSPTTRLRTNGASHTRDSDLFDGIPMDFDIEQPDPRFQLDQPLDPLAPKIIFALFAHNSSLPDGSYLPTLNILIDARLPNAFKIHENLVRELFEWIGSAGTLTEITLVGKLIEILANFATLFWQSEEIVILSDLVSLISNLALMFPVVSWCILDHPLFEEQAHRSRILPELARILTYFDPSDRRNSDFCNHISLDTRSSFLCSFLYLVQVLAFDPTEACLVKLEEFIKEMNVVGILLGSDQPLLVVSRSVLWLYRLSTHPILFRSIMASVSAKHERPVDGRVPLLNVLSNLLTYGGMDSRDGGEIHTLQLGVLRLLSVLSVVHDDAISLMSESVQLIGKIVSRIAADVGLIMNRDVDWLERPDIDAEMILTRIKAGTLLLRSLVKAPKSPLNLRSRLQTINGAHHNFVVNMGQLAFSPRPVWLIPEDPSHTNPNPNFESDSVLLKLFEGSSECAKDLLGAVVSPEEEEEIYDTFRGVEEESIDMEMTDEELDTT